MRLLGIIAFVAFIGFFGWLIAFSGKSPVNAPASAQNDTQIAQASEQTAERLERSVDDALAHADEADKIAQRLERDAEAMSEAIPSLERLRDDNPAAVKARNASILAVADARSAAIRMRTYAANLRSELAVADEQAEAATLAAGVTAEIEESQEKVAEAREAAAEAQEEMLDAQDDLETLNTQGEEPISPDDQ